MGLFEIHIQFHFDMYYCSQTSFLFLNIDLSSLFLLSDIEFFFIIKKVFYEIFQIKL